MQKMREGVKRLGAWLSLQRRGMIGVFCILIALSAPLPSLASCTGAVAPDANACGSGQVCNSAGTCVSSSSATATAGSGSGDLDIWATITLGIAHIFSWVSLVVVQVIVELIDLVVVPIMRYNNFVNAPIVTQGWVVVRDLVNMFFVVVLLIIAFQTIFSVGRADWKKQVPRLLIMAIVINFSRTIAGIMIDFGQVVMLTFVNAIADVAGGNFIQLFGLDKLTSFSSAAATAHKAAGFEIFDLFGAALMTMLLTFVILATMIILAALLAFRIVILWCLIIVSPLTFFLGGAKGVVGPAESYYADWWKRFTGAVSLGPILTFFVWLSLAAASGGSLADKQGFDTQTTSTGEAQSFGSISSAFDAPHLTSLIVAIALLFAGFEVSSQTASSIGGRAGAMAASGVKGIPGLARSLGRVGVPLGATGALIAAAPVTTLAALSVGAAGVRSGGPKGLYLQGKEGVGQMMSKAGSAIARSGAAKVGGRLNPLYQAGQVMIGTGSGLVQGVEHTKAHDLAEAKKKTEGLGLDELMARINAPARGHKDETERSAAILEILLNKNRRKEMNETKEGKEKLLEMSGDYYKMNQAGIIDEPTRDKFGKALAKSPELAAGKIFSTERANGESWDDYIKRIDPEKKKIQSEIDEQVATYAEKPGLLADISSASFDNTYVRESLRNQELKTGRTAAEHMEEGLAGPPQRDAWNAASKKDFDERKTALSNVIATAQSAPAGAAADKAMKDLTEALRNVKANDLKAGILTPAQLTSLPVFSALTSDKPPAEVLKHVSNDANLRSVFFDQTHTQSSAAVARGAAGQEDLVNLTRAGAKAGIPVGYSEGKFEGATPAERQARADAFKTVVQQNPEIVVDLAGALKDLDLGKEMGKAVASAIQSSHITKMQSDFMAAPTDSAIQQRILDALVTVRKAIEKNTSATTKTADEAKLAQINLFRRRTGK